MSKQIDKNNLAYILRACKTGFIYTLSLSCLINLLMLTIPIYMLQVFDRVIPSQSFDTLIYLTVIAIVAIFVLAMLDIARTFIMIKIGTWIDNQLSPTALSRSIDHTLSGGNYAAQSLADITSTRQFLSSSSIYAFFDAPWVFVYLTVIMLLYTPLGLIAIAGAIGLFALTILNEKVSRSPLKKANSLNMLNQNLIQNNLKNSESIQAMGMISIITSLWFNKNQDVLLLQAEASEKSGIVLSFSKALRMALQILILGGGAYYVVKGEITSGTMLAASIILSRALAPIEQSISVWKQALSTLEAYSRLRKYFNESEVIRSDIQLPTPKGLVTIEKLVYLPKGSSKPILQNINLMIHPGESLAIIGLSGSGKSTLARLLVGVWLPTSGNVRLDGADIYECSRDEIGKYIGYLPQEISLFSGAVKDNIARLHLTDDNLVIAAAKFVNAHDKILHFAHGYETRTDSYNLSGGQKQMVALARAFYGMPKFVVLDEPESNLDEQGLKALEITLKRAKAAGMTIVMVTQRPSCAEFCDKVMAVVNGNITNVRTNLDEPKPKS